MATFNYNAQSDDADDTVSVDKSTAQAIMDTLETWADGDPDRYWQRATYDNINELLSISVRVENVDDVSAFVTTINNGINNLNSTHGTAFPQADSNDIRGQ